ncbi:MAG: HAD-IIA family hydrolase [Clostridiales bacterium]|nr:HAD-IIA family hydrolase [Clostridiales bacterium]
MSGKNAINAIVDLDGTIYRGDRLLDYAKPFFGALEQNGIGYKLFTNCSRRTPAELAADLRGMGLDARESDIVTTGCIARSYIRGAGESAMKAAAGSAMGTARGSAMEATAESAMEAAGGAGGAAAWETARAKIGGRALVYAIGSDSFKRRIKADNAELAENPGLVADYAVVGFCTDFTYGDLSRAMWHIDGGARFIATNLDETIPFGRGAVPHTGAICAFLERASGQKPINLGKPSRLAGEYFRGVFGQKRVFVVGDRIDTDMLFAENNGFAGCLVLTGIATRRDAESLERRSFDIFADLRGLSEFLARHSEG